MKCEKCGQQLNNWNAFCPNCGKEAPATSMQGAPTAKSGTIAYSKQSSPFAGLSVVCWVGMLALSIVSFNLIGGFYFRLFSGNLISAGLNVICAVVLIFGGLFYTRGVRKEPMIFAMGLYAAVGIAQSLLFGRFSGSLIDTNLLRLIYFAMAGVITIIFFVCERRQTGMKAVTISSIACAVIWCLVAAIGYPLFFSRYLGIPTEAVNAFMFLFHSVMIKDLLFFGGAALLRLQSAGKP